MKDLNERGLRRRCIVDILHPTVPFCTHNLCCTHTRWSSLIRDPRRGRKFMNLLLLRRRREATTGCKLSCKLADRLGFSWSSVLIRRGTGYCKPTNTELTFAFICRRFETKLEYSLVYVCLCVKMFQMLTDWLRKE